MPYNEKETNIKFCPIIQKYPVLYKNDIIDEFSDPQIEEVWANVAKEMGKKVNELSCIRRWRTLVTRLVDLRKSELKSKHPLRWHLLPFISFVEPYLVEQFVKECSVSSHTRRFPINKFINPLRKINNKQRREDDIKLCNIVKGYPVLYNEDIIEIYSDEEIQEAWENVADEMGHDVSSCKERWEKLKDGIVNHRLNELMKNKILKWYMLPHICFVEPFLKNQQFLKNRKVMGYNLRVTAVEENSMKQINASSGCISEKNSDSNEDAGANKLKRLRTNSCNGSNIINSVKKVKLEVSEVEPCYANDVRKNDCVNLENSYSEDIDPKSVRTSFCEGSNDIHVNIKLERPDMDLNSNNVHEAIGKNNINPQNTFIDLDYAFLESLIPDIKCMNVSQKRKFKMGVLKLIDDLMMQTQLP